MTEARELFGDPNYLVNIKNLVRSMSNFKSKMESRKLLSIWTTSKHESSAVGKKFLTASGN